jgi:hypothetical protein
MNKLKYPSFLLILVMTLVLASPIVGVSARPLAATAPTLGAAASFSVLGKAGVTNTGNTVLSGSVGADSSITGFPPGSMGGTKLVAPAVNGAEADALTADGALTAQGPGTPAGPNLTGATLVPGVYSVGSALLPGTLTLNGAGVYIFLVSSNLTSSGTVSLTNGAAACNVFWHVTSSAAISGGAFVGTIIAGTSITFGNAASLNGRALALTGNVTLINNSISGPNCAAAAPAATATLASNASGPTATAALTGNSSSATATVALASNASGATATTTLLPAVNGLPNTGGAPIRNEGIPWNLALIIGGFGAIALFIGIRAFRRLPPK